MWEIPPPFFSTPKLALVLTRCNGSCLAVVWQFRHLARAAVHARYCLGPIHQSCSPGGCGCLWRPSRKSTQKQQRLEPMPAIMPSPPNHHPPEASSSTAAEKAISSLRARLRSEDMVVPCQESALATNDQQNHVHAKLEARFSKIFEAQADQLDSSTDTTSANLSGRNPLPPPRGNPKLKKINSQLFLQQRLLSTAKKSTTLLSRPSSQPMKPPRPAFQTSTPKPRAHRPTRGICTTTFRTLYPPHFAIPRVSPVQA